VFQPPFFMPSHLFTIFALLFFVFQDTEEWFLFLTAAPSNPESAKRFPMTPSDVSRTRKRLNVETIIECGNCKVCNFLDA
jgi:hypothetical protein